MAQALGRPFCDLDITGRPESAALLGAYHSIQIAVPGVPLLAAPRPAAAVLAQIAAGCPDGVAEPAQPVQELPVRDVVAYRPGDPGWQRAVEATVGICMGTVKDETRLREAVENKLSWLSGLVGAGSTAGPAVFLSSPDDAPQAFVELIPLGCAHVPVPFAGARDLFLTCIHADPDPAGDPRAELLRRAAAALFEPARETGSAVTGIWAVSGRSQPYPNGPLPVLQRAGFREVAGLARVWLPDRGYDELVLVHRPAEHGQCPRRVVGILVRPDDNVVTLPDGGAQAVLFTTGRGTPTGSPVAPVIKIATNDRVWSLMRPHLDFPAGGIAAGRGSVPQAGERLLRLLLDVLGGRPTCSEALGHREFAIYRLGPTV